MEDAPATDAQDQQAQQALSLKWAFGFNKLATGAVHNLSDDYRNAIFYTAAHSGVVYDYVNRTQTLLQGHCNPITACAVSSDKRWLVTADDGHDSMIVVWDSFTGAPIKTIFNPHPNGVRSLSLSPDALFIITLSSPFDGQQEVAMWEWAQDHDGPLYHSTCPALEVEIGAQGESSIVESKFAEGESEPATKVVRAFQDHIQFNESDLHQFATTGQHHVTFWSCESKQLEHQTPEKLQKADFGSRVGEFTRTVFLGGETHRAVTGTTDGNLVVWDVSPVNQEDEDGCDASAQDPEHPLSARPSGSLVDFSESKTQLASTMVRRSALKMVKLNRSGGIPYLTTHHNLLVVCGTDESVRMYDFEFRIVAWYEDLEAGPVTSVSFSNATRYHYVDTPVHASSATDAANVGPAGAIEIDQSSGPEKCALSDFVISTSRALIIGVDASVFDDASRENRHGTLLLQGFDGRVAALLAHPSESVFVAVSESGIMQAWDFNEKRLVMVRVLGQEETPVCAAFSPDGKYIAIGFDNGLIRLLRWAQSRDLGELACFHVNPGVAFTKVAFSPALCDNGALFLGLADEDCCVGLFRFVPREEGAGLVDVDGLKVNQGKRRNEPGPGIEPSDGSDSRNGWIYVGRYGSHTQPIASLSFGMRADGKLAFVSVGQDGALVEYDLEQSSVVDGIKLVSRTKIEHSAQCRPTCCLVQPATKGSREDFIVVANSEFKIKNYNASNHTCRKTTLGPTYGKPLNELVVINRKASSTSTSVQYLAYSTSEKVIGLVKMPLDGNPYKSMGLIAHPGEVSSFAVSHDGDFLLSAGGSDMTVNIWAISTSVIESACITAAAQNIPDVAAGLVPFLPLLQGGHEGALYEELVDFFYYAQLRCQGEDTTSPRRADGLVPLAEIPNLMRALGFYPTESQIKDMCAEIRYSEFSSTAKTVDVINLEQFIKLYINHRPVLGTTKVQVVDAFNTIMDSLELGSFLQDQQTIDWKTLRSVLETGGEAMSTKELESCLTMLMGRKALTHVRPSSRITPDQFAHEMLGFQLDEELDQEQDERGGEHK